MEKNVPSVIKSLLALSSLTGLPYSVLPNSTLNQKLNIQAAATLNTNEIPRLKYLMIGNGGLSIQTGADNHVYIDSFKHTPVDTGLFSEMPFLMRPIDSDISESARLKYRLRKLVTQGGQNFFAYYGKVLDFGSHTPQLQTRSVNPLDNTVSVNTFVPSPDNLDPTPTLLSSGDTVDTGGSYVSASLQLDVILDAQDVLEILNVSQLLFGNTNHATISEIALCSGVDRSITVNSGGVTVTYTEAIAVQLMSVMGTNFPSAERSNGMRQTYDIGNSEPLMSGLVDAPVN